MPNRLGWFSKDSGTGQSQPSSSGILESCIRRRLPKRNGGADRWNTQTECLAKVLGHGAALSVTVRFLHLIERSDGWQEAAERDVQIEELSVAGLAARPVRHTFAYRASRESDERFVRTRKPIHGVIGMPGISLPMRVPGRASRRRVCKCAWPSAKTAQGMGDWMTYLVFRAGVNPGVNQA